MQRKASALWRGAGLDGTGELTTTSGALSALPYSTKARFENEDGTAGTNPEELVAAAHAGCFNMALAFALAGAGHTAESLTTEAVVTIEKNPEGSGWAIKSSELTLRGRVPGLSADEFRTLAEGAKTNCPISKALGAIDVRLNATLEQS